MIVIVEPAEVNQRLDQFLAARTSSSRCQIEGAIKDGLITVNSIVRKQGYKIKPADVIEVTLRASLPQQQQLIAQELDFDVVYQDDSLIVVDKPPQMVMYPGAGHQDGSLINGIASKAGSLATIGGPLRPGIVHRIDRDTSGLVVVALNDAAYYGLVTQFKDRTIKRSYTALLYGKPNKTEGEINLPIGRSDADRKKMSTRTKRSKTAITRWRLIRQLCCASIIEATLLTGRTHQIRVHFAAIGHPVLGDDIYGKKTSLQIDNRNLLIPRQMLHARVLGFVHPITQQYMEFKSQLPPDMTEVIAQLKV
ncbi:MAG: RluA family pseudouridine synthase [Magnetococcales bacterium]|uniref:Pseudouridine synthase n=1 Tax=Candidatus Magnetobacterium casense TaxID=1455061 RepID=A0ABS6S0I2_9BACT|nr:RluA family pseudouridine synthase [Candidatus Magnetobacterium casensis]MBF0609344.1 RluA family pseudouridine synthase [Nitrospirota bacterium]MBV6342357.1 RluA family pseudouridine synthase [Candidatus Magnetobacterium casensis]